jgi:hypothetical protein
VQARSLIGFGIVALLAQGCAPQQQAAAPAQEPYDEAGHAAHCDVAPNPLPISGTAPADVKMTVGNDGGWCAVRLGSLARVAVLRTAPEHGTVYFRNVASRELTRLQYTPATGYSGTDSFVFQLQPSNVLVRTSVTVTRP